MVNTIFNWAIVAIVSSFTMMPVSINRQTAPISEPVVEEAELKGCATNLTATETVLLIYTGPTEPGIITQADVENLDNWALPTSVTHNCTEDLEIACAIRVSEDYFDENLLKLKPTINLQADEYEKNQEKTYFVIGSADGNMEIYNTERP